MLITRLHVLFWRCRAEHVGTLQDVSVLDTARFQRVGTEQVAAAAAAAASHTLQVALRFMLTGTKLCQVETRRIGGRGAVVGWDQIEGSTSFSLWSI